jgi:hypothetical protein
VGREFRGHDVFYRVLLDGVELVSQRPSTEVVDLGSRVSIRVHEAGCRTSLTFCFNSRKAPQQIAGLYEVTVKALGGLGISRRAAWRQDRDKGTLTVYRP